jgi:hypothetical protein
VPTAQIASLLAQVLLAQHGYPVTPQITQNPAEQMVLESVHSLLAQQSWLRLPQASPVPVPVALFVLVAVLFSLPVPPLPPFPPASRGATSDKSPFFQHLPPPQ